MAQPRPGWSGRRLGRTCGLFLPTILKLGTKRVNRGSQHSSNQQSPVLHHDEHGISSSYIRSTQVQRALRARCLQPSSLQFPSSVEEGRAVA